MSSLRRLGVAALLASAACSKPPAGETRGLEVTVDLESTLTPSCIVLEVRGATDATVLGEAKAPFAAGKLSYHFGVLQRTLPEDVRLRARALSGTSGCTGSLTAMLDGADTAAKFTTGVTQVSLSLSCATAPGGCAAPVARLAFTSAPQTLLQGTCSQPVTVQAQTAAGAPVTQTAALGLTLDAMPAGAALLFSDPACTTALGAPAIAAGSSGLSFHFRAPAAGAVTLSASATGIAAVTQVETVTPAAVATQVAITSPARTAAAGSCSARIDLELQDAAAMPVNASAPTAIALAANPSGGFQFFSDAACSVAASMVTVAPGSAGTGVYFKGLNPGAVVVTASSGGLTSAMQTQTVSAGMPAALAFTTAAQMVNAGACSAVVTVETRDAFGNTATVSAATQVMLAATGGVTLFSDASCTTAATSVNIASGQSSAGFYFSGTAPGSPAVTATSTGLTPANQVETITPAPAANLTIASAAQTRVAGACSALVTLQVKDMLGNNATVTSATTVNLSAMPSGMTFYSDAGCTTAVTSVTIAAGTGSATFSFRGSTAGSITLTAAATGFSPASQLETITPAAATVVVFTSAPQTVVAAGCSAAVGVQTRDAFMNPSNVGAAANLNLTSSGIAGFTFYSNASCTTTATTVTVAAGTSTAAFFYKSSSTGSAMITVGSGAFPSVSQAATIVAGNGSKLVFTTGAQTLVAGACSGVVTVEAQDMNSNPSPAAAATPVGLASAPSSFTFYSDAACTTVVTSATIAQGASSASFYFTGTLAGAYTLTGSASGFVNASQAATINAAAAARLRFTSAAQTVASTVCSGVVTVTLEDQYGNARSATGATAVTLMSSAPSGFTFYPNNNCGGAAGTMVSIAAGTSSQIFTFKATTAGSITITGSSGTLTPATQIETITGGAATKIVFTTNPQSLTAGQCSLAATAAPQDTNNNFTSFAAAGNLALSVSPATAPPFAFFSDPACTMPVTQVPYVAGATAVSFYFMGFIVPGYTITASTGAFAPITQPVLIGPRGQNRLGFSNAAMQVPSGGCSGALTVQMQDQYGNATPASPARSITVTGNPATSFFTDAACTTALSGLQINSGGTVTPAFYMRGPATLGPDTLTASTGGGITNGTQIETIVAGAPAQLAFSSMPLSLIANVCSGATLATVEVQDVNGNPTTVTAAITVTLTAQAMSNLAAYSNGSCTTLAPTVNIPIGMGSASFRLMGTKAGTWSLTATSGTLTQAVQSHTVAAGPPSALAFLNAPVTAAAGACSPAVVVSTVDGSMNVAPVTAATTVTLASGAVATYSDAACATAASSVVIPIGMSSATFYYRHTVAGTYPMTASSVPVLTTAMQSQAVTALAPDRVKITSPARTVTAGGCSQVINVSTTDPFGNVSSLTAPQGPLTVTPSGSGFTFFTDSGCMMSVTTLSIPVGNSATSFYFRPTTPAGMVTLTVNAMASMAFMADAQAQTVNPAAAAKLGFTTPPLVMAVGTCSPAVTVTTQDPFGNASNISPALAVTLSASPAGMTFYSDAMCTTAVTSVTIANNTNSKDFYVKSTASGMITITASGGTLMPGTQVETFNAGVASKLAFPNPAVTVDAAACSPAVVIVTQDAFSNSTNVSASTAVTLGLTGPGTASVFTNATCTTAGSSVTIPAGMNTATLYFKSNTAGSYTANASSVPVLTPASQPGQTVNPLAPTQVVITSTAAPSVASGACSPVVNLQTQDQFGNASNLPAGPLTVTPSSLGFTFFSNGTCTTGITTVSIAMGAQAGSFYFKPSTPIGARTLTVTADLGLTGDSQAQNIVAGGANKWAFTGTPVNVVAGSCSPQVTFEIQDASGNPTTVPGATTVTATGAGLTFFNNPTCTNPASATVNVASGGTGGGFYFKTTVAGMYNVSMTSTPVYTPAIQPWTVIAGAVAKTVIAPPAVTLLASECSGANTVTIQDANSNNAAGPFTVNLVSTEPSQTFYSDSLCTTAVTSVNVLVGSSTATFYWKTLKGGVSTIRAQGTGIAMANEGTQADTITNTVRSPATCTGGASFSCTFSPAVASASKTFFVFQATNDTNGDSQAANVRCALDTVNLNKIDCVRGRNVGTASVSYQIVEFPSTSALNVIHLSPTCTVTSTAGSSATQTVDFTAQGSVTTGSTFVLFSSGSTGSNTTGQFTEAYKTVRLTSSTTLDITYSTTTPCIASHGEAVSLQLVNYPGATVTRNVPGPLTMPSGMFSVAAAGSGNIATGSRFLLYSYRLVPGADGCNNGVRGELIGMGAAPTFTRGAGSNAGPCATSAIDDISWERVVLPVNNLVQPFNLVANGTTSQTSGTFGTTVDPTRTVVFAGGQHAAGQASGEADDNGTSSTISTRSWRALSTINGAGTTTTQTRASGTGLGSWTSYVIQFAP